jgi:hypothetical protein
MAMLGEEGEGEGEGEGESKAEKHCRSHFSTTRHRHIGLSFVETEPLSIIVSLLEIRTQLLCSCHHFGHYPSSCFLKNSVLIVP